MQLQCQAVLGGIPTTRSQRYFGDVADFPWPPDPMPLSTFVVAIATKCDSATFQLPDICDGLQVEIIRRSMCGLSLSNPGFFPIVSGLMQCPEQNGINRWHADCIAMHEGQLRQGAEEPILESG